MKRIYRYPTGAEIPKGAIYLSTVTQTKIEDPDLAGYQDCWFVWHYFLVEDSTLEEKKV